VSAPRIEIDLDKIRHNASELVSRLARHGISVTGVTKAVRGLPDIAGTLIEAGATGVGDSRIENIETMRRMPVAAIMTLIRSPMLSQVNRVVASADVSFNTEIEVISKISAAAENAGRLHGVVLMVELGDLREGIMPGDLFEIVRETLSLPSIILKGIGTNLACRSGVSPDSNNMMELSELANSIEAKFGLTLDVVSGGNSANLMWALSGADTGRVNNLRLGESILLGCETLNRRPIDELHCDAITVVAEVIESKIKPTMPRGTIAQTAFGQSPPAEDRGNIRQVILAVGRQDIDPAGLIPPAGVKVLEASSDHLIVESNHSIGSEIRFQLDYSALMRAMTSPYVYKEYTGITSMAM
jgi:ornithine racemase